MPVIFISNLVETLFKVKMLNKVFYIAKQVNYKIKSVFFTLLPQSSSALVFSVL